MTFVDGIASAFLPTDDRGLHYGDGLFETLALIDGEPRHWRQHMARLALGAQKLAIAAPEAALWEADLQLAHAASPPRARRVLKLMLTRGSGGRGYAPPSQPQPRRVLQFTEWPPWPATHVEQGIRLTLCDTPIGRNRALAGLKHLNRLEQVLGAAEVAAAGTDEGLMFDDTGALIEGTRTNVFLVVDGELLTPLLDEAGVAGILRALILKLAPAAGIPVREARVVRAMLARAEEIFVCNSLAGVWPVREIVRGQRFRRWPLTARVMDCLDAQCALP